MSPKRQPSKQRRQAQNQRQRAALETRRANAAASGAMPGATTSGGASVSTSGSGRSGSGGGGSLLSRLRGSATTGRSIRTGTPVGGQPIGYRAALSALLAAGAGAIVAALLISVPVNADGDMVNGPGAMIGEWTLSASAVFEEDREATAAELADAVDDWTPNGSEPYAKASFPLSVFLVLPVVGAGLAFRAVSKRAPAKVVNRAMYVTLFGTLLSGQPIIFLPTVVGIGIAAFQVRKAEIQAAPAEGEAATGPSTDGDVIDVEEADEVEAEELAEDDSFLDAEDAVENDGKAGEATLLGRLRRRP